MKEIAHLEGFVTAAAKAVDEYNKGFPGNRKKKLNTAEILTINLEIYNKTVLNICF